MLLFYCELDLAILSASCRREMVESDSRVILIVMTRSYAVIVYGVIPSYASFGARNKKGEENMIVRDTYLCTRDTTLHATHWRALHHLKKTYHSRVGRQHIMVCILRQKEQPRTSNMRSYTKIYKSSSPSSSLVKAAHVVGDVVEKRCKSRGRKKSKKLNESLLPVTARNVAGKWDDEELLRCNVYADGGNENNKPIQPMKDDNKKVIIISIKKKNYLYQCSM